MNARDFCFWLQGFFELQPVDPINDGINPAQAEIIRKHLNLVFIHDIDPSMGPLAHQAKLNDVHNLFQTDPPKSGVSNPVFRC